MSKPLVFLITLIYIIALLHIKVANAQNNFSELEKLEEFANENEIINGEMWGFQKKYEGHPFWNENSWYHGYVISKGEKYDDLAIRYDIHSNDIIIFSKIQDEARLYRLNKQFLERFALFDPVLNDTVVFHCLALNQNDDKSIYQKVYDGRCKFYIQNQKSINNIVNDKYTGEYVFTPVLLAKIDKDFVEFLTKTEFLHLFGNLENEIKKFMRQKRIKFKRQSPENLRKVFQYYDSLIVSVL